jgi:putative spermidine/putrescine transport system substrate-binding protein
MVGAQWLLARSGPGATNHFEGGGFVRGNEQVAYPNLMFHFLPIAIRYDGSAPAGRHGYQVHIGPMNSDACGQVRIISADPARHPATRFNYLSTAQDRREWVQAIRVARHILNQPAFEPFNAGAWTNAHWRRHPLAAGNPPPCHLLANLSSHDMDRSSQDRRLLPATWDGLGREILRGRHAIAATAAIGSLIFAAGCSSSSSSGASGSSSSGSTTSIATATSAAEAGGMNALVTAAKKEGQLNVITLPANWANYGTIMKDFTAKYGIKITDANPEGSSGQEIAAVQSLKGQSRAPDVVDVGSAFAVEGANDHLWAPYKVATWNDIPANAKDANGDWYGDYGGYVAIGYNPAKVNPAPTSFASLTNPAYKNMIVLNNSPTTASAAFSAVYAAALANGGSLSNIEPGIKYFAHLKAIGNFVPTSTGGITTVQNGTTPIIIWWDYLLASEVVPVVKGFKIVIPSDASYAAYYDQAISATAPDPAAARLWEEYLYSTTGQNLWLAGFARPIELPTLSADGTVNKTALAALPPAPSGAATFPTEAQQNAAEAVVSANWTKQVG